MRNMGIVRGSKESAIPFDICVDTVYIRMNIEPVPPQESGADDEMGGGAGEQFQYHEIQYDLREWLRIVTESVIDTNSFTLAGGLVAALETGEEGGIMALNTPYVGLPEQKPFTFNTRFTQRKAT